MKIKKEAIEEIIKLYKEKTEKECYKALLWDEMPDILDDKLGGKPYLPVGEKYPVDSNGNYMNLLLQVNLKNIKLKNFPSEGILEVFTNIGNNLEYCVKLFKEGLEYQTDLPEVKAYFEGEEIEYFIKRPILITLEKDIMHMPTSNYKSTALIKKLCEQVFDRKFANHSELEEFFGGWEKYFDFKFAISEKLTYHKINIGGYPHFNQDDIRENLKPRKNECIFSIDSVGLEEFIQIVDSGIIFGFSSKEDLKNANFDNVLIDYDFC